MIRGDVFGKVVLELPDRDDHQASPPACYICSGASMPSTARPSSSTRAVRSHKPSRSRRTSGSLSAPGRPRRTS